MSKRVLVAALAAAAVAAPAASAYTDPTGDNHGAPDIANVDVRSDAGGLYTITINTATDYAPTSEIWLYFDTDNNRATGDVKAAGAEYLLYDDRATNHFALGTWAGDQWNAAREWASTSFAISPDSRTLTATVSKAELGGASSFNFFLLADQHGSAPADYDNTVVWSYSAQAGGVTLTPMLPTSEVQRQQHAWTVAIAAVRSDTGGPVGSEGSLACTARAGGTALPVTAKAIISAGMAYCRFRLPKKHVRATATITVSYGGSSASKTFTVKT